MLINKIKNLFKQIPIIWIVICLSFTLTGCINYQTGISFYNTTSGVISQHIEISEQLTSFSPEALNQWVTNINQRAAKLNGKVLNQGDRDFLVTIPFSNPKDLAKKFNNLLNSTSSIEDNKNITANLKITDNNFIVASRYNLNLAIDLQPLNLPTNQKVILDSNSLLDLKLIINSPTNISINQENTAQIQSLNKQIIWQIKPGITNNLSASLWLPNPLGIGAVIIIIFVLLGYYLKYKTFPGFP